MAHNEDGKPPQRGYRAKLMHADGSIETTIAIMAADEAEALQQVRGLASTYTVELWQGSQRLTTIPMRRC